MGRVKFHSIFGGNVLKIKLMAITAAVLSLSACNTDSAVFSNAQENSVVPPEVLEGEQSEQARNALGLGQPLVKQPGHDCTCVRDGVVIRLGGCFRAMALGCIGSGPLSAVQGDPFGRMLSWSYAPPQQKRNEPPLLEVRRAYKEILGRDPDPSGQAFYISELQSGRLTVEQMRASMMASPERKDAERKQLQEGLQVAYQLCLAREPDETEFAHYKKFIEGNPRKGDFGINPFWSLRSMVCSSHEAQVTQAYRTYLARDPDPSGKAHYTEELKTGRITLTQLQQILRTSDERKAIVNFNAKSAEIGKKLSALQAQLSSIGDRIFR